LKLDKYKLLEETDDFYRLDDGSGQPFRVAKKGLGSGTADRITQHFAMGGQVNELVSDAALGTIFRPEMFAMTATPPPAPPPAEFMGAQLAPIPGTVPQRLQGTLDSAARGAPPATPTRPVGEPVPYVDPAGKVQIISADSARQAEQMGWRPAGPNSGPIQEPAAMAAPAAPAASVVPPPAPVIGGPGGAPALGAAPRGPSASDIGNVTKGTEAALLAQGEAAKAQAQAEVAAKEQQEQQRADFTQDYKRRVLEHQQRGDALFNGVMASNVEPGRLWASKTGGQKMGSIAAIIMSGIGQGLAGGPNMALQILDNAIERDIEAQKANLSKNQGLLAHHAQGGRDVQAAYQLAKADMLDSFAGQLQKTAGQFAGRKSDADVQMAVQKIRGEAVDRRAQAAATEHKRWVDMQQLAIERAKLGQGGGLEKKDKEALTEVESRYKTINGSLDRVKKLIGDNGTWEAFGAHNDKLQQEITNIATDAAKISDPGSVNRESEVKLYKELLGDPGFWSRNSTVQETLQNFRAMVEERRNTAYRVRGMGSAVPPPSLQPGRQ
jgi:hypothetical protein